MIDINQMKPGKNFLGILNDIKRRPEDAAKELGITLEQIHEIIEGRSVLTHELIEKAVSIWPINARDFYVIQDDSPVGVKIMRNEESKKSSRIMSRASEPYYEYRDTAMSTVAPFRPEWILELCHVEDNEVDNPKVQWNNGHFMHQFTYFIGDVNFYYKDELGNKKVAIMSSGDSMYIAPFTPHTFTARGNKEGLILALTYGGKLTGDVQQELSGLSVELGSKYAMDFSTKQIASSELIKFHREIANLTISELSRRSSLTVEQITDFEIGTQTPTFNELEKLSEALHINIRDILPNDKIEKKVIVQEYDKCNRWFFPENSKNYEFVELASTSALPFSKGFEITVNNSQNTDYDLESGLHQHVYNIGTTSIHFHWKFNGKDYHESLSPGDSMYVKPFVTHCFQGNGKLLVLRIGGKIAGDSQRELSIVGKKNTERAISETMQWFDSKGKH